MSVESPHSDGDLLDLLRIAGPMGVADLADAMEVTPTAVRQRLTRLMSQHLLEREVMRLGRGRPKHRYHLTEKGLRLTGSNFTDLAVALWRELGTTADDGSRRDMLRRIARTLAMSYIDQVQGDSPAERMRSLGELLNQRRIPVAVDDSTDHAVLTEFACPYPKLAEQDRGICMMEKMLFSELVGNNVELTQCRLDGGCGCRFQTR